MHPVLIKIGPITIYTYGFFIASAFLLALGYVSREARKQYLDTKMVSDVGFYIIISGILGARVLYVLMNLKYFFKPPSGSINGVERGAGFFWRGNFRCVHSSIISKKQKNRIYGSGLICLHQE